MEVTTQQHSQSYYNLQLVIGGYVCYLCSKQLLDLTRTFFHYILISLGFITEKLDHSNYFIEILCTMHKAISKKERQVM